MEQQYLELLNNVSIDTFDTDHKAYRARQFLTIMNRYEERFINSFKIDGDKRLSTAKQIVLFRSVFRRGIAGVFSLKKAIIKNGEFNENEIKVLENLKIENDELKALSISPNRWDENERVVTGPGITAPRNNLNRKTYMTSNQDTAYLQFNSSYESGWIKYAARAYMDATIDTVIKKKLSLSDIKLATNNVNNSHNNKQFDDLYEIDKSFINLSPAQSSMASNSNKFQEINVGNLMSDKIAKLNMSNDEGLIEIIEMWDLYKSHWNHMMGIRVNTNKKGERNINAEFDSEEVHFGIMKEEYKKQLEIFKDEYLNIYGVDITIIDMEEKIMDDLHDKEIQLSNSFNNASGEDDGDKDTKDTKDTKDKGDKNE